MNEHSAPLEVRKLRFPCIGWSTYIFSYRIHYYITDYDIFILRRKGDNTNLAVVPYVPRDSLFLRSSEIQPEEVCFISYFVFILFHYIYHYLWGELGHRKFIFKM